MAQLAALRDPRLYLTAALAAALGVAGALVTVAFIEVLRGVHELVWTDVPDWLDVDADSIVFLLPVCALGGVLVGVLRRHLGEWPHPLEQSLADFERDRAFDYRHIWQGLVISLVSLGFGAALGPEAALVAIIGGAASWIAQMIRTSATGSVSLTYLGTVGALGALFGTAGAAALPLGEDDAATRPGRLWLLVPGLAAAGAGALIFSALSSGEGYFDYGYPAYDFAVVDLAWAVPAALAGAVLATAFLGLDRVTERLAAPLAPRPVLQSLLGGVALAVLATTSSLVLFSGHEGIQELLDDPDPGVGFLLGVALAKIVATTALLATGWKGGRFFPIMFAGAAVGLALHALTAEIPAMVGLSVAMTAAIAGVIQKPVPAALLMLFVFPRAVWVLVILAALIGGLAGRVAARRVSWLETGGEPDPAPA